MTEFQGSRWRTEAPAVAALALLGIALARHVLGPDVTFALFPDNEFFLGPVLSHMSAVMRGGEWPLWMETVLGGVPLHNFSQLSPFYPGYLLFLPLYGDVIEAMRTMHGVTLAHLFILQVNAYVLLRTLRLSRTASVAGATLFAFNANMLGYVRWMNIVAPYAWLPLFLAGVVRTLEAPSRPAGPVLAVVAITLLTFASPAQPLIHAVVLTAVLFAGFAGARLREGDRGGLFASTVALAGVGIVSMLVAAPVIVPVVSGFGDMIRWIGPFPPVYGYDPIPFEAFQYDQVPLAKLPGVLFRPDAQQMVGSVFVGLAPFALAAAGATRWRVHWAVAPLALLGAYALLSSTGGQLGFAHLNYVLPLVNKIREPSRFLVLFQFAVAVLAAFGIDRLMRTRESSPREDRRLLGAMLAALVVAIVAIPFAHATAGEIAATVGTAFVAFAITAWAFRARQAALRLAGLAWSVLAVGTLALLVPWTAPPLSYMSFLQEDQVALDATLAKVAARDPDREYRVLFNGRIHTAHAGMLATYRRLRVLNSYFNPAPRRQFEDLAYHGPRQANYFQALGARFLVCDQCPPEATKGYVQVDAERGYTIWEAADALPRTWVTTSAEPFTDAADYANRMSAKDLRDRPVFVAGGAWAGPGGDSAACSVLPGPHSANRVRYTVSCPRGGLVVLNEYHEAGWIGRLDGTAVAPLRVNGTQMGIAFGPGSHSVEFVYTPRVFRLGLVLAAMGLCLAAALLGLQRWLSGRRGTRANG